MGPMVVLALTLGAAAEQAPQPTRIAQGEALQICGTVTTFTVGKPSGCDATLEVETESGRMVVVLPAVVRRGGSGGRELEGARACFSGSLQPTATGETTVRVRSMDDIRVDRPSSQPPFASGVVDACLLGRVSPQLVREQKPSYTADAMRAKVEGVVSLEGVVDPSGAVTHVRVTESLHPDLDREAMTALQNWEFKPALLDGVAVPVIVQVQMSFKIRADR